MKTSEGKGGLKIHLRAAVCVDLCCPPDGVHIDMLDVTKSGR